MKAYDVGCNILITDGKMPVDEWAIALREATGWRLAKAQKTVKRYQRQFLARCNANGMGAYPVDEDGNVAGISRVGHRVKPTFAIIRADRDDPKFLEYERHIVHSGNGSVGRGDTDLLSAIRRGDLSEGAYQSQFNIEPGTVARPLPLLESGEPE